MAKKTLDVKISGPDKTVWEGKAQFVMSENSTGKFSIFPGHANFITALNEKLITIKTGKEKVEFTFPYAVLYTHEDFVSIYTLM